MKKQLLTLLVALAAIFGARAAETIYLVGEANGWDAANPITLGNEQEGWYCLDVDANFGQFKLSTSAGSWPAFDAHTKNVVVTQTNTKVDLTSSSANSSIPSTATTLYVSTDFTKIAAGTGDWRPWQGGGDDPIPPTPTDDYYVIVDASRTGWTEVGCFWWGGGAGSTNWPGEKMTPLGDGKWKMNFVGEPVNVIFNDNQPNTSNQTIDLPFENKKTYVLRYQDPNQQNKWTEEEVEDPIPSDEYYVIVDASRTGWSDVKCFWWGGNAGSPAWPGQSMTAMGNGKWKKTFSGEPVNIIFNNGSSEGPNQTVDLTYVNKKTYVLSGTDAATGKWTENGGGNDDPTQYASGTLPILYINIYQTDAEGNILTDADGNKLLDNYVISKDLGDKNYRPGEYWLDINGCPAFADYASVGSAEKPLPLTMKARGNFTRTGFAKKPFKLKLDKKQSLLGMTKSKHWAILAHADDNYGYLRNFTGFNLGKRMGLPWTPAQQPVEVIINGDYRGLYFLTESIRVGDDRVPITELDDNCDDRNIVSGGYLVELDNYPEENQIRMTEGSCAPGHYMDELRVTFDTPEEYSDLQRRFINEQFTAMNYFVSKANTSEGNDLWTFLDLDDAARYYIVEEICSHVESYHGSTYLFRDRGEGQKWHFSPLWDMGNAFNGSTNAFLYDCDPFGNTWIPSMRRNEKFNQKVVETWKWFMSNCYPGLTDDINNYVSLISEAAKADHKRWGNAPMPSSTNAQPVVDNTDMQARKQATLNHLNNKINWLRQQWGDYNNGFFAEPERDTTPAAALPEYAKPLNVYLTTAASNWAPASPEFKFSQEGDVFTLEVAELFGNFRLMGETWALCFGGQPSRTEPQAVRLGENTLYKGSEVDLVSSLTPTRPENSFYLTFTWDGESDQINLIIEEKRSTGSIDSVIDTDADGPATYYNLQGQRVSAPQKGAISIEVRNGRASKIAR